MKLTINLGCLPILITSILVIFKLTNLFNISWFWVFSPLYVYITILLLIILLYVILIFIFLTLKK